MNRSRIWCLAGLAVSAACAGRPSGGTGGPQQSNAGMDGGRITAPELPSVATCASIPTGRSYVSVFGDAREADRVDQALGVERDLPVVNTKWYQFEVEERLYSIFRSYPHGRLFTPEGVVGTFNGVRPERTFSRVMQGPLTAVKLFEIGFQICLEEISDRRRYSLWDKDDYQSPPTPENARVFCEALLTGAYQRPPDTSETDLCVEYATQDVSTEPDPARQWAHVCGMVGAMASTWTR